MTLCDCNPNIFGQPNGKTPIDVRLLPWAYECNMEMYIAQKMKFSIKDFFIFCAVVVF